MKVPNLINISSRCNWFFWMFGSQKKKFLIPLDGVI